MSAAQLGESSELAIVHRAVLLDPANSELHHRLGMLSYYSRFEFSPNSGVPTSLAESIKQLERAVELNPIQASYWSDLASACEDHGDQKCADCAFERALKLSPMTPRLRWLVANHYLRTDRMDAALAQFRELLVLDPMRYASPTFQICLRVLGDPQAVVEKVLPRQSGLMLKLTYVDFLMEQGRAEYAYQVWADAVATASSVPFSLANPYLERLIQLGRGREAQAVWQDLLRLNVVARPESDGPNGLIFNGDFERVPLNAGFDWRYRETPYISLDFANPSAYRGRHCLQVDFTASANEEYEPVYEIVPVVPDWTYLLSAYLRSDGITSDSGPRLRVLDPFCPQCLDLSSDTTLGTTSWHRVSLTFSTKALTQLARISVWRPRGRTFPYEISGTFWLDSVSLTPINPNGIKPASDPTQ